MRFIFFLVLLIFPALPLKAQIQIPGDDVFTTEPLCLRVKNDGDVEALGHVETDEHGNADGTISWHRSTFRLPVGESQEFCSTGPFFPGKKLRVMVKAAMPLYSCKVTVPTTVTLSRVPDPNFGGKTWIMDCVSEKAEVRASP